jgi:WD40 repeat protein
MRDTTERLPLTGTVEPARVRARSSSGARWAVLLLLGCLMASLLYIARTWRREQEKVREATNLARREIAKREDRIDEMKQKSLEQHDEIRRLQDQLVRDRSSAVRFSPDGSLIALLDKGTVSIRDAKTGQELTAIKEETPCTRVEFLPALMRPGSPHLALTHPGKTGSSTALWELTRENEKVRTRKLHAFAGDRAQFSEDGTRCLTQTDVFLVWDVDTGKKLATFPPTVSKEIAPTDLAGCSLSPDGRSVIALTGGGQLFVGEIDTGKFHQVKE